MHRTAFCGVILSVFSDVYSVVGFAHRLAGCWRGVIGSLILGWEAKVEMEVIQVFKGKSSLSC